MATIVINSAGRSAQSILIFLSRVLRKIRHTKRKPTPVEKNDHVISVEPKVQIEYGAPRLMITTIAQPMSGERRVRPVAWVISVDIAGQTLSMQNGMAIAREEDYIDDKRYTNPEEVS